MNEGMHPGIRILLLLTLAAALATASFAQTGAGLEGKWRHENKESRTVTILELKQDAITGRWTGDIRNSRMPQDSQELRDLTVTDRNVRFTVLVDIPGQNLQMRSEFDLQLRSASDELRGSVNIIVPGQIQREQPLVLTRVVEQLGASELSYQPTRPVIGAWNARPDQDDKQRQLVLEILPDGDQYRGTLTDTGREETVSLRDLLINDRDLTISFNYRFAESPFLSSFWGRYEEERDRLRGSMSSGGRSQALVFTRSSPGPESMLGEFATTRRPLVRKHETKFAATARIARWTPLYVLKEQTRNINDITTGTFAIDAGLRYHLVDYLAVQARVMRGGLGFDTNAKNLGLFDPQDINSQGQGLSQALTADAFLKLDGYELSIVGYLGQSLFPQSKFNPFFIGLIGRTVWELTDDGRGSQRLEIFEVPLQATDWTFGGGLGTEYALSPRFGIEAEWVWAYIKAEDKAKWSNVTEQWTSQHVFRFSLGGVFWF